MHLKAENCLVYNLQELQVSNNCSQFLSVCNITANTVHSNFAQLVCVELLCLETSGTMQQNVSRMLIPEFQEN